MTPDVTYISEFNSEVVTRLPLYVQRVVDRVRQFVLPIVDSERRRCGALCYGSGVRQIVRNFRGLASRPRAQSVAPRIVQRAAVRLCRIAGGNVVVGVIADR